MLSDPAAAQQVFPLYKKIPNSKAFENIEKTEKGADGILRTGGVSIPSLTVFAPSNGKASTRTAVIICPGGGYGMLSIGHEGYDVAKALNDWGITAFVLKYRLPDDRIMINKATGPLQDAQRAIQWVREHAKKYDIDKNSIVSRPEIG